MSANYYALVSRNHRYGVNLNQILTNHLNEHGQVDDQGQLLVNFDEFQRDMRIDLTFVLFNDPERVKTALDAATNQEPLPADTILGVTSLQTLSLDSDQQSDLDQLLDDQENEVARWRRLHQVIDRDSDDQSMYQALVFDANQFDHATDPANLDQAITAVEQYVQTALKSHKQGMIDKYRRDVQPFLSELDTYTQQDYQKQAKRYKAIISLDSVERARLNGLEQKLFDQHEFRSQLTQPRQPAPFERFEY